MANELGPNTPPASLSSCDWLTSRATQRVFRALSAEGAEARAVGGCVRNALIGEPVSDIDIATDAVPDEVLRLAERAHIRAVPTGLEHGTVTLIVDATPFEVTTLRRDVATFGRHATVAFTKDWVADASRRDFTINAIYCDADGRLFDPLGGLCDLEERRVRFIGRAEDRIREDYLRILRFFRFHARFARSAPDPAGLSASIRLRSGLARLSPERIHAELVKLLLAPGAPGVVEAMFEYGLLVDILGAAPRLSRFLALCRLEAAQQISPAPMRRLASLAVDVPEDVWSLTNRLRLSNAERDQLLAVTGAGRRFAVPPQAEAGKAALYRLGGDAYRDSILLAWANTAGADKSEEGWQRALHLPEAWQPPEFPLSGRDLIQLGLPEGPQIGKLMRSLEASWVSGGMSEGRGALLSKAQAMMKENTG